MKREDLEFFPAWDFEGHEVEVYLKSQADKVMDAMEAKIKELGSIPHTDNSAVIALLQNHIKELESMLKDKDGVMDTCRGLIESANVMRKDAEDKLLNCIKKLEAKASEDYISYQRKVQKQAKRIAELEAENERLKAQVPKWISVKDRLPEDQSDVLFIDEHATTHIGSMWKTKKETYWYGRGLSDPLEVHHWMLLPPPPTTEESSATEKERK